MIVDDTNAIANLKRYQIRDIHETVRLLSNEQKQILLSEIQLQKATHNFEGLGYDQEACNRIESLLNGKRPRNS